MIDRSIDLEEDQFEDEEDLSLKMTMKPKNKTIEYHSPIKDQFEDE